VYYVGPDEGIWKVPLSRGQGKPALKIGPRALWTLSATGVYLLDPDAGVGPAIEYFPFAPGKRTEILPLGGAPDGYVWGLGAMAASPDGRWLLYEHRDRCEADLGLVEDFRSLPEVR
jgi:hypothetical protein